MKYLTRVSTCYQLTTFTDGQTGERFCFLSNTNNNKDVNVDLKDDGMHFVPAWSVSILGACKKEIYNSAKVKMLV